MVVYSYLLIISFFMMAHFGVFTLEWCEKEHIACFLLELSEAIIKGVCEVGTRRREGWGL